jgi:hypothetical protein
VRVRPVRVASRTEEDAALSFGEQERFDLIAEALVAKLQDLPDVDGGKRRRPPPPPRCGAAPHPPCA